MKLTYLLIGLLVGGVSGYGITKYLQPRNTETRLMVTEQSDSVKIKSDTTWNWSDSLEALTAAPVSHKIVYEDSTIRVLQVILAPNQTEPIHTHKWRSIMWFSQATPMTYFKYNKPGATYAIEDSFSIPRMPPAAINHGEALDPEGPHAIKNVGKENGIAFRIEFKK
ncbi:MAG: hypothetical protein EOO02_11510 [Chitinophagaceae bacterium]|nr:MAG: hypothetical protein EOO02_11510 [Chitinophagaceae bacterium]